VTDNRLVHEACANDCALKIFQHDPACMRLWDQTCVLQVRSVCHVDCDNLPPSALVRFSGRTGVADTL
jgi:hypothetical protein